MQKIGICRYLLWVEGKKMNGKLRRKIIRRRCPASIPRQKKQLSAKETKTRFLEIFEVVEFDHVPCTSSSGLEGTCLHESDCQGIGGATMGTCADGYGACCVIQYSCDDTSAAAAGWFTNPGFPEPSSERLSCAVSISKQSEDVKQIRLDFLNFEVTQLQAADDLAAPTGCLQYFKGSHGYLQSFNYRDVSDTSIAKAPSYLMVYR
ncbi:hypothetical protein MSG28_009732 [Choristoneura fumiferana]|uniref:Uncharacterized protein n=2 Tax=Choristoneura fumiferana TaxID=7141 RepID=A0ACC0JCD7_CHOFU|nr:hypothetical protein MSG28_009732 [Choristoneura fumiferana]KAI8421769.1 hypothetical protein MSG28_009732 [Choristoneura fumiferana]